MVTLICATWPGKVCLPQKILNVINLEDSKQPKGWLPGLQMTGNPDLLQAIAPEAFARWCEAASETLLEEDDAFIHCPNPQCGIPIEKVSSNYQKDVALQSCP